MAMTNSVDSLLGPAFYRLHQREGVPEPFAPLSLNRPTTWQRRTFRVRAIVQKRRLARWVEQDLRPLPSRQVLI